MQKIIRRTGLGIAHVMTRTGKPDLWAQLFQRGAIQDLVHKVVASVNKNLQSDYPGKEDVQQ